MAVTAGKAAERTSDRQARPLRIAVHDYSGHPFQVQLSRALAERGHVVTHLHCPSYRTGKGQLERRPGDAQSLEIAAVPMLGEFQKYSLWRRPVQEALYARRLMSEVAKRRPEVLISSNTPLVAQRSVLAASRKQGIAFVYWHQDLYSLPIETALSRRVPVVGASLGKAVVKLEKRLLRLSDAVITISPDFVETLQAWGVERDRIRVIENWAPLPEVPLRSKSNPWAQLHDLADKRVILYAGTLGVKHNPGLLYQLAVAFRGTDEVRIVVVSEGEVATELRTRASSGGLTNLICLPYQAYEDLPDVLGTADVLVALLEPEAGVFSVPSKVLTYLCAGRPILGAMPTENLAARILSTSGCGVVVAPDDVGGATRVAKRLLHDERERRRMGDAARDYAERVFRLENIADKFEDVVARVLCEDESRWVDEGIASQKQPSLGHLRKVGGEQL